MSRNLVPRVPLLLTLSTLNDAELHLLVGDVKTAAATSKLVANNPGMAASVAALLTKDGAFTTAGTAVDDDRARLHADLAVHAETRTDLIGELRTYATFVGKGARTPADVHGAGLVARETRVRKLPPAVPEGIDDRPPKKGRGRTVVAVHETTPSRDQFVAEQSLDGVTFTPLGVARGKTRVLTGASGTQVWVRFARVRGSLQSAWCTAAMITIP